MILQASNGCFLTQSEEVPISERRFEKSMIVSSMEEAALWKEIPESEKDSMIEEGNLFYPDNLDYNFLNKLVSLLGKVSSDINNISLTNNQPARPAGGCCSVHGFRPLSGDVPVPRQSLRLSSPALPKRATVVVSTDFFAM